MVAPRVRKTVSSRAVSQQEACTFLSRFLLSGGAAEGSAQDFSEEDYLAEEEVRTRLTAVRSSLDRLNHKDLDDQKNDSDSTANMVNSPSAETRKKIKKEEKALKKSVKKEKKEKKRKRRESKEANPEGKKIKTEQDV